MLHSLRLKMRSREASWPCDSHMMSMTTAVMIDVVAAVTDNKAAVVPGEDMVPTDTM